MVLHMTSFHTSFAVAYSVIAVLAALRAETKSQRTLWNYW